MFDKFLEAYLDNILDTSDEKYDLTDENIRDIIYNIKYNDDIWERLYSEMIDELDKYKIEEEGDE